jgi:hypothetical protein
MTDYLKQAFSLATCTLEGDEREKAFKELEKIQKELEDAVRANPILEWTTEGFGGEDLKD